MSKSLTHADLVGSLAAQLWLAGRRIVWKGVGVGSRWLQGGSIPVPDVLTVAISYTRPDFTNYEVKAQRQDFRSDVSAGKYRRYLDTCNRLFFAAPGGLIARTDVPAEAGLITYNADKQSWTVTKAAPRRECELAPWQWQSLLFARWEQGQQERRLRDTATAEGNRSLRGARLTFASEVREALDKAEEYDKLDRGELAAGRALLDLCEEYGLKQDEAFELVRVSMKLRQHIEQGRAAAEVLQAFFNRWQSMDMKTTKLAEALT